MVDVAQEIGTKRPGQHAIIRPYEVVELAAKVGLWLPYGCAMLNRESYGGQNVWGGDAVSTGGTYVKGRQVTKDAYLRYRDLRNRGVIGNQGVGPGQLTARGYQEQADAIGGCWDWRCNVTVAFRALSDLVRVYGLDGLRRYNGSGPRAEEYRRAVVADAAVWNARITRADPIMATPYQRPAYRSEDMIVRVLQVPIPETEPRVGILTGGRLIGLSGNERNSALASGVPIVDLFPATWDFLAADQPAGVTEVPIPGAASRKD